MRELVQQMTFGRAVDKDAPFTDLVHRQSRFVFRVAWAVLRNIQDSEDVVQETFLRVHRSGTSLKIDDERAFLATTAWRLAVDRKRHEKKQVEIGELECFAPGPEREAVSANWNESVARLIEGLPEELRQPLVLSGVDEMTSREIAKILGIPEGTIRTRIMRARQILKQKLENLNGRS